ncbi:MAG: type II toxin-antitoxin system RelE/ParE family toxin [Clostridiales bacterium]|jgi:mRNA interferase RelE/StbE|nr:type II toxin-antitoxin system RelE/ParE family toxin [Clostridiales bacterium]
MSYIIDYSDEAKKDMKRLDGSQSEQVAKIIRRVARNPLPKNEGGYGEPLGHVGNRNLTGYNKIKLLKLGIRVVYKVVKVGNIMRIIVVAARSDAEVYDMAERRILGAGDENPEPR